VVKAGWSFWITLPAAGLFAAIVAILVGLPILRLRGVYFAMITLVLTQVVTLTALALPITNGAKGISNIPLPSGLSILGIPLIPDFGAMENTKLAFYLTACILMVATYAALYRLVNSRLGHLSLVALAGRCSGRSRSRSIPPPLLSLIPSTSC